jgi:hypothetical protein
MESYLHDKETTLVDVQPESWLEFHENNPE